MGNEASVAADGALRAVQERFEEKVAKLHNAMAPPNCRTNFNEEVNGTNGQQQAAPEMTQEQREGEILLLFSSWNFRNMQNGFYGQSRALLDPFRGFKQLCTLTALGPVPL